MWGKIQYYRIADLEDIDVMFTIKRLIDENKTLAQYSHPDFQNEIMFSCQLFVNGYGVHPVRRTRFTKKLLYDEGIIFNCKYKDLSYDAIVAINIWATGKSYDQQKPLASTTFSLFDQNLKLRSGKYHLMLWPDQPADSSQDSSTPGITHDKNINELNYITDRVEMYQKNARTNNRSEEALKVKLLYTYKLIPAAFLQVQMPTFNYPVYFQDQKYQTSTENKINNNTEASSNTSKKRDDFSEAILFWDTDYQSKMSDPLEELFFSFYRQTDGQNSMQLHPSKQEAALMDQIASRTYRQELKPNEKLLFFKYRYNLLNSSKHLLCFLESVQWNNQWEEQESLTLLSKWSKMDLEDALYILSSAFCANAYYNKGTVKPSNAMRQVRQYAVNVIAEMSNRQMVEIMLQLVQALRYEPENDSPLANLLEQKSCADREICTLYYWYLRTETSSLPASQSKSVTFIHDNVCAMYKTRFQHFMDGLASNNPYFYANIMEQSTFVDYLKVMAKHVKSLKKDLSEKKEQMRRRLVDISWANFQNLQFPMNVRHTLIAPIKQESTLFSSAMTPFKLSFQTKLDQGQQSKLEFIYKSGDDLRQDQLILQMFSLMDSLLKGVNQDYKLIPYKALACSKEDGFVEFVPRTTTIQDIIYDKKMSLGEYLIRLPINPKCPVYLDLYRKTNLNANADDVPEYFIQQNQQAAAKIIMENYILSCAGYCAITYFFGIGDRHLQNLLLNDVGKIFHIDFGFILGRDPKPYPPLIKLNKQMALAMGGIESQNFRVFKSKCLEAYLYLRRYSKLIINLFLLMMDSGIKDLRPETMNFLADKFCPNLNDEEAQKRFLLILQGELSSIFPGFNDAIHVIASSLRK